MQLSVIVPAYNEAPNLKELVERTVRVFNTHNIEGEIIIVDDGSEDETGKIADELKKTYRELKVVHHTKNFGKTQAIISGTKVASYSVIAIMDADLQYEPESLPELLKKFHEGYDIVTGWKKGGYEKQFVSSVYNRLSRWLFKLPIHDQNAIKVLRKEIIEKIPLRYDWHRYIVALAYALGYKASEVRVPLHPRKYGKSKYRGSGRVIIGILDMLAVKFLITFSYKPLLFFGIIGGILLVAGVVVGAWGLYERFVLHHGYRPLIFLTMLLILAGLILFGFGFVLEILGSILDELKRKSI